MSEIKKPIYPLIYQGSVKNLLEVDSTSVEFEYTDAYSVFDWGRMPDSLPYKGESLAALGEYFFKKLSERGIKHHLIKRSAKNKLLVKRVPVIRPQRYVLGNQTLYSYADQSQHKTRLIPIEAVFRWGVPQGSSFLERATPEYLKSLGLKTNHVSEGSWFETPVIEFFTKLEPTDRFLTYEQAFNYSGLSFEVFSEMFHQTILVATEIFKIFKVCGLELWDGKVEWALFSGELTLVDSIGPDELRLIDPKTGYQLSKEFLRQFYRHTKWYEELTKAKVEKRSEWKELVLKRVGEPPALSQKYLEVASSLYPSLAQLVTGENPGGKALALDELSTRMKNL